MATASDSTASGNSASRSTATDLTDLSYEQARDELVRVVNELEQGSSTLEESLALWERGEALARRCEEWLIGAKARLDAARGGAVGNAAPGNSAAEGTPSA
ncbi:exodeoxyribonuclease VII small subunit [Leifsonia bigeumensis]|uniref:Exodeoxyribonuclease 7 small subunit n=1 Tax=Leifsonella bigeumensis TaxID=433643 RepID=A0ABP7FI47_9MICO